MPPLKPYETIPVPAPTVPSFTGPLTAPLSADTTSASDTCRPWMSLRRPSSHSATTGVKVSSVMPISGYCAIIQVITPLATLGTFNVLVSAIGYSKNPDSLTQASPVISPVPLSTNDPAATFLCHTSSRGMTTVTPVRTGPWPGLSGPSPEIRVV